MLWGAVSGQEGRSAGHCCFTSHEISPLVEGELYAGKDAEETSNGNGSKRQGKNVSLGGIRSARWTARLHKRNASYSPLAWDG